MNLHDPKQDFSAAVAKHVARSERSDPLSDSLLYLAAYHGRALSRSALLAGLPIEDGELHTALYERAAQRAGLQAELKERSIEEIPSLVLPAARADTRSFARPKASRKRAVSNGLRR